MRTFAALAFALSLSAPVFGQEKTIVETAAGNDAFSTLVAAVKAADLVEVLSSEGPFTVFAPTNEAFAKLPEGTLDDLLKPENKEKLATILKYHVVPGNVLAADVVKLDGEKVATAAGPKVTISVSGNTVRVDQAKVVQTDIACSNGVIHVIDTVILPPAETPSK
ncbi:fasciclin domain-containing protein [Tautonia sociabilis]|uniref:Fasciclin domain-containing protein n=1 Tax=Tautonia sociabilis TaxID=2080755 RepID=A0A432MI88_9BACT|nr:fasciclin domain-containing protein [Tautonia sociabilis]RUL86908.1 fasciclin domain-containing protein [Tautonia sociabilis]